MIFQFKQFSVQQSDNAHKVGTDSMVLGAWTEGYFETILDIGTGTGVLALMLAQKNPTAQITGIEPNANSYLEAELNFKNSAFADRLSAVNTSLQNFRTSKKFDLIICNPPYFVGSTLSQNAAKNAARHMIDLQIEELYTHVNQLLEANGRFSIVFPSHLLNQHLKAAQDNQLFPSDSLVLKTEAGSSIRQLMTFCKTKSKLMEASLIVKYESGLYSKAYVELTKDFHNKPIPYQKF